MYLIKKIDYLTILLLFNDYAFGGGTYMVSEFLRGNRFAISSHPVSSCTAYSYRAIVTLSHGKQNYDWLNASRPRSSLVRLPLYVSSLIQKSARSIIHIMFLLFIRTIFPL